jgi:hypothetical protein
MKALADLKSLEVLDLAHTQVSDEGLVHLAALKELYNLHLHGVSAEAETVRWLEDQLPKKNVIASYAPPPVPLPLRRYVANRPKSDSPLSPIFQAAREWKERRGAMSAGRVLNLAARLRDEVNKQLPFRPYTTPLEVKSLAGLPAAAPGRHTLLGSVQYASNIPPGPGESYINTCLVFLDDHLLATQLKGPDETEPKLFNGYISQSVVVVDGAVGISSYIGDSIVIAAGPIVVHDGYINNSLVISLDGLRSTDRHEASQPNRPTIYVRDGYINNSVVLGRCREGGQVAMGDWPKVSSPIALGNPEIAGEQSAAIFGFLDVHRLGSGYNSRTAGGFRTFLVDGFGEPSYYYGFAIAFARSVHRAE